MLQRPLLLTGEPATGKTQFAFWAADQLAQTNNFHPTPTSTTPKPPAPPKTSSTTATRSPISVKVALDSQQLDLDGHNTLKASFSGITKTVKKMQAERLFS
jgi:hypothetical protein